MNNENNNNYHVPLSLESHFKDLQSQDETSIKELYSSQLSHLHSWRKCLIFQAKLLQ